jgi:hypothetical protein
MSILFHGHFSVLYQVFYLSFYFGLRGLEAIVVRVPMKTPGPQNAIRAFGLLPWLHDLRGLPLCDTLNT